MSALYAFCREIDDIADNEDVPVAQRRKALQLTNILRDVRNDFERGRIYLPRADMARFGVTESEILEGRYTEKYYELARYIASVARDHYAKARACLPAEDRRNMATAELM